MDSRRFSDMGEEEVVGDSDSAVVYEIDEVPDPGTYTKPTNQEFADLRRCDDDVCSCNISDEDRQVPEIIQRGNQYYFANDRSARLMNPDNVNLKCLTKLCRWPQTSTGGLPITAAARQRSEARRRVCNSGVSLEEQRRLLLSIDSWKTANPNLMKTIFNGEDPTKPYYIAKGGAKKSRKIWSRKIRSRKSQKKRSIKRRSIKRRSHKK